jgi:5-(carboxyamino)imidazole ribonucleotide mutase
MKLQWSSEKNEIKNHPRNPCLTSFTTIGLSQSGKSAGMAVLGGGGEIMGDARRENALPHVPQSRISPVLPFPRRRISYRTMNNAVSRPRVGVIMGSQSDWDIMKHAVDTLDGKFGIACEARVLSAHRTPHAAFEYASSAVERGLQVIIAGAGMAAHLAGVMAGLTPLPVLGVPLESPQLKGLDSLLSTVQMPGGIPVATFAIGKAGAINAAVFAASILALSDPSLKDALDKFRNAQTQKVLDVKLEDFR